MSFARRLSQAGTRTAAETFFLVRRTLSRPKTVKTNSHHSLRQFTLLINYSQEMRNFGNCPAHRVVIWPLNNLVELCQAQAANDFLMLLWRRDEASIVLNSYRRRLSFLFFSASLFRHNTSFEIRITSPQLACHANAPIPSDPSFLTAHQRSRAQRCVDWLNPAPSYGHHARQLPA